MKKKMTSTTKLSALLLAGVFTLTACGDNSGAEANDNDGEQLDTITIALSPNLQSLGVRAAESEGLFEEEGLEVDIVDTQSGSEAAALIAGGDAHFAHFGTQTAIMAIIEGHNTPLTAPITQVYLENPHEGQQGFGTVIVAADSDYETPSDLENTQIGVSELGGTAYLDIRQKLEQEGVDVSTIEWLQIPGPQQSSAVRQGQISAAMTPEPNASIGIVEGTIRPLFHADDIMPGAPVAGLASDGEWAAENTDLIQKVQRAVTTANARLNEDRELAETVTRSFMDIDDEVISTMKLPYYAEEPFAQGSLDETVDRLIEFELMSEEDRSKANDAIFEVE